MREKNVEDISLNIFVRWPQKQCLLCNNFAKHLFCPWLIKGLSFKNDVESSSFHMIWYNITSHINKIFFCNHYTVSSFKNNGTFYSAIGLLRLAITWYKIRHAGGQAHYYSRNETLKQRQVKLHWFRSLCFNVPMIASCKRPISSTAEHRTTDRKKAE